MKVSTPGRICLFGEHQDYLGLPVIAAAISRRVAIMGSFREDNLVIINMPDIDTCLQFELKDELVYTEKRDYFKSAINVLQRMGYRFSRGIECEVRGNIPINSGTSSSSALLVSWIHFLLTMADTPSQLSGKEIGEIAFVAEVIEFNEAGGMMDQYSTAVGDVIYLESVPAIHIETLTPPLGTFVLGDSLEPKDTQGILRRVKDGMLAIIDSIKKVNPLFNLEAITLNEATEYKDFLTKDQYLLLKGNISDRDILREAKTVMQASAFDHKHFGKLLSQHHANLHLAKKISTTKIERMIANALAAGALGAKINGSGGGGCMFAYAPHNPEKVAKAIEEAGGKAYIITVDNGTCVENI
jgi:galactokinase